MKRLLRILSAASLALGLAMTGLPCGGAAAAASAQGRVTGGDRGGQGNSGDEKRERDVCQRRSQHRPADQGSVAAVEPQLSKGSPRSRRDRRPEAGRPREGDRRRDGEGLCQRVYRAGAEGPGHVLQVAARPEIIGRGATGNSIQHVLYERVGAAIRRNRQWRIPRRESQARQANLI